MSKAKIIRAPQRLPSVFSKGVPRVFLGGAIDNGTAPDWQSEIEEFLSDYNIVILNPRRKSWNPNASSDVIKRQVKWELDAQHVSDINIYVFPEKTIAPITLLELGLFIKEKRCLVYCAKDYWRYLNVVETCKYYNIGYFTNWKHFKEALKTEVEFMIWLKNQAR